MLWELEVSQHERQLDLGALVEAEAPLEWVGLQPEKTFEKLTQDKIW